MLPVQPIAEQNATVNIGSWFQKRGHVSRRQAKIKNTIIVTTKLVDYNYWEDDERSIPHAECFWSSNNWIDYVRRSIIWASEIYLLIKRYRLSTLQLWGIPLEKMKSEIFQLCVVRWKGHFLFADNDIITGTSGVVKESVDKFNSHHGRFL